jgi:hypothetical protein|tara:strand:+ start:74 stop:376 length:303 start_codon:yes stop_codon:yes gene_type:complete
MAIQERLEDMLRKDFDWTEDNIKEFRAKQEESYDDIFKKIQQHAVQEIKDELSNINMEVTLAINRFRKNKDIHFALENLANLSKNLKLLWMKIDEEHFHA